MSRSYYVIELSARWLTVLLVALALIMVLAFALGYGAAWSVLSEDRPAETMTARQAAATPTDIPEVVIPTSTPGINDKPAATATPKPTATPVPEPTTPPTPRPTATPATTDFFVQILATSTRAAVGEARTKLEELGFPRDNQLLIREEEAGEPVLFKLRVGPFPDRSSAERVSKRMSEAGFHGAWIVAP